MINKLILCACVLLIGCNSDKKNNSSSDNKPQIDDVIMNGDSLCDDKYNSTPVLMGIQSDCVGGRPLMAIDSIDYNYRVIFLALGTNDIWQSVSVEDYREKLESLMSDNIVCILPNERQDMETQEHRHAMIDTCHSFVDPVYDCAVSIGNPDGVHYIEQDYIALSSCLNERYSIP